jgi:hypothetical protein
MTVNLPIRLGNGGHARRPHRSFRWDKSGSPTQKSRDLGWKIEKPDISDYFSQSSSPIMKDQLKAYVCVYRHTRPSPRDLERTRQGAENESLVARYLAAYQKEGSFLDWGDDPAFFCSQQLLKNTRRASWGVCRRDVRLTFDVGLLTLPRKLWDYVIVHELLHFRVPNHGRLWKSLMRAHLGRYESYEEELRRHARSSISIGN